MNENHHLSQKGYYPRNHHHHCCCWLRGEGRKGKMGEKGLVEWREKGEKWQQRNVVDGGGVEEE
ncbi:hypothetical protein TSUD_56110 [Trifolium subterraneum]|uniref:Uncharacterized protein n=1 Tax=Trifolium subterraneum TaxID=3900 RepID=A0A2Z6M894_TRISU|nr:hypothetical protein TSUD_56110 [Trifolium subterraneum]